MIALVSLSLGLMALLAVLGCLALAQRAAQSLHDRRRRRNYGRVTSRAKRPVVMLNVRTAKA